MTVQEIKQRFGIIGSNADLDRAIYVATQVAPTDLSVLVTGESGTGKEVFPQIVHQLSIRKHGSYIAVNCGAIPEGTIDSELFGHEKGSFTGAHEARKGYFEVANGGTIFLDEVAELPLSTQARLLRVLESGEFLKVGSSKVQKTDVRVIAATNVNIPDAISKGRFREDLYYRLNTIPILIPPLRSRNADIGLLFRKFASDFAVRYRMPAVRLTPDAQHMLEQYAWPGNIRQLKNVSEQISVIEKNRDVTASMLAPYLPHAQATSLPALVKSESSASDMSEREILYKVLFDLRRDLNDVKKLVLEWMQDGHANNPEQVQVLARILRDVQGTPVDAAGSIPAGGFASAHGFVPVQPTIEVEESLSLDEREKALIIKALEKNRGKRKYAAKELGISERTLYRKIHEYNIKG